MYDEFLLAMEMMRDCCDDKPNCDADAAAGHVNRALELQKSVQELLNDYPPYAR